LIPDAAPTKFNNTANASANKSETQTSPITHIVEAKETLFSIAKRYSTSMDKIISDNQLTSSDLKTGQTLLIVNPALLNESSQQKSKETKSNAKRHRVAH
jgi:LysM repeat protein